jgi:hypothetical protein
MDRDDKQDRTARARRRLVRALTSTTAKRIYLGLLGLLIAFLWLNMVRRAITPGGSQFLSFVKFSEDLVYRHVNVYREYSVLDTVTKYPPFFSLLFAPLVPLPPWLGAAIWFWVSLGLAVGAAYAAALAVSERDGSVRDRAMFVIPLVLAAGIVGSNLETAQVNHVTLFLVTLALYMFRRGRDLSAGALIGVAAALKLTPALFILYFLYKRAYRVVAGAGVALVVCWLLIPPLLFGFDNFGPIMSGWWGILTRFLTEGTIAEGIVGFRHTNQSLSAAFHRFFTQVPADGGRGPDYFVNILALDLTLADRIVKAMVLAILGFLVWICRTPLGERGSVALAFEYSLIWIATLFISPISWINHYVFLLFPFAAAVYYIRTRPPSLRERRLLLYGLGASFLLVSSSASRLPQAWSLPFLGALVLAVAVAVALRAEQRAPTPAATATSGTSA